MLRVWKFGLESASFLLDPTVVQRQSRPESADADVYRADPVEEHTTFTVRCAHDVASNTTTIRQARIVTLQSAIRLLI